MPNFFDAGAGEMRLKQGAPRAVVEKQTVCDTLHPQLNRAVSRKLSQQVERCENGVWRSLDSAFDWGSKGRGFESRHPDFLGLQVQKIESRVEKVGP